MCGSVTYPFDDFYSVWISFSSVALVSRCLGRSRCSVVTVDAVSTAVKAFAGCEFVGLALDDGCCGTEFAGNDRFASVSNCSVETAAAAVVAADVGSMVVKAFVGCESDSVHDSRGCYAANVAPL